METNSWSYNAAKRIAIFHMTAPLGTAFGGYLVCSQTFDEVTITDTWCSSKQQYIRPSMGIWGLQDGDGCTLFVE